MDFSIILNINYVLIFGKKDLILLLLIVVV